jgi:predicted GNAT family acetyltransferase
MPATARDPEIVMRDNHEKGRFEATAGRKVVAFAEYRALRQRIVVVHTEVAPGYAGRGVGRRLVQWLLDDIRTRGLKVTPICPFTAAFIERHPAYGDLVSWGRERAT